MKRLWQSVILITLLLFSISVQAAFIPRSETEIPLYPGTNRDQAAEKEIIRQDAEYDEAIIKSWRSNTVKVYTVKAIVNDVAAFYIQKLGAKEGMPDSPGSDKPGTVISPWYDLAFYEPGFFDDQYDDKGLLSYDGKWVRTVFSGRKQWRKGEWLNTMRFEWNIILNNGDIAQYSVTVEDEGYDALRRIIFNTTRITIRVLVTKSEAALIAEADQTMDQETTKKAEQFAKNPPTERMLGVPLYPGSVFDPESSAGMSLDEDYQYFIYLSNDPPAKVVAFYEQRLGRKALAGDGGYLIVLKGNPPIPEEGMTIQANIMFGGKAKAVITIQKKTGAK